MKNWEDVGVPKLARPQQDPADGITLGIDAFSTPLSRDVARHVSMNGPVTAREVAEALGVANLTVHRTLLRLEESGVAVGDPGTEERSGRKVHWTVDLARVDKIAHELCRFIRGE